MADRELLVLNESTPQIIAPSSANDRAKLISQFGTPGVTRVRYLTGATNSLAAAVPADTASGDLFEVSAYSSTAPKWPAVWKCTSIAAALPVSATAGSVLGTAAGKLYILKTGADYYRFELVGTVDPFSMGAMGDGTTDDILPLRAAAAYAVASGANSLWIPSAPVYYKISDELELSNDSFSLYGDGVDSCIVNHNAAAADAILVTGSHVSIDNIGVTGILGSGNGIHINGATGVGQNRLTRIWCGWNGAAGVLVTQGQSNTFTDVSCDQNSGYRPITLTGGATEGSQTYGIYVKSNAGGNTNNQSFVNCRLSGAGSINNLKIGDTGVTTPESCSWHGGLIQGSGNYEEVYLHTKDFVMVGTHIEPPVGATSNYVVTMDGCSNTVIQDGNIQGDVTLINSCVQSGLRNVRGAGFRVSSNTTGAFWDRGEYRNITTGPAGGEIIDLSSDALIQHVTNSSNSAYHASNLMQTFSEPFIATSFEYWYDADGSGALIPYGFVNGTGVTRSTAQVNGGTYSAKVVPASDFASALNINLPAYAIGRKVFVNAWCYNETTAGAGYVVMNTSAATVAQQSYGSGGWERIRVTFTATAGNTPVIRFTGLTGDTIYWDRISIWIEDYPSQPDQGYVTASLTCSTSGTITLSSTYNRLQWAKAGRLVTYTGYLQVTSVSSPLGVLAIEGLAHTCATSAGRRDQWTAGAIIVNSAGIGQAAARVLSGNSKIEVYKYTAGDLDNCAANFSGDEDLYVNVSFFTDD